MERVGVKMEMLRGTTAVDRRWVLLVFQIQFPSSCAENRVSLERNDEFCGREGRFRQVRSRVLLLDFRITCRSMVWFRLPVYFSYPLYINSLFSRVLGEHDSKMGKLCVKVCKRKGEKFSHILQDFATFTFISTLVCKSMQQY